MNAVQCRMARAAVGFGIRELAQRAGVAIDTVARLERGDTLRPRTVEAICAALEEAGVEFIEATETAGVGVRLKGDRNA
ncbi:transcriptional regulator [Rhodobacter xanthinilyticus]|uniref:Transcriptional regulator n=1 Tax=Rhodobacter xanthinilyticus TaxID=1850250 RepID=A0A1D9MGW0_9RHOB|nr:helix-turn-helix domain-containing protein [Rhodobacter xanthinilyticus]AOZ70998.1 transcriptional regulator [Rhodobacter xanthinilyticus]